VLPTLRRGRQGAGAQVVNDGRIAIFGGTALDQYCFGI